MHKFISIISIIFLSGCSPVDKQIDLFNQLKTQIEIGDIAWVEENSKDIFSLKIAGANQDVYESWGDDWWGNYGI